MAYTTDHIVSAMTSSKRCTKTHLDVVLDFCSGGGVQRSKLDEHAAA